MFVLIVHRINIYIFHNIYFSVRAYVLHNILSTKSEKCKIIFSVKMYVNQSIINQCIEVNFYSSKIALNTQ